MANEEYNDSTTTPLSLKWSISRGQETYGWNILTMTDQLTGKKYRANGGGYDMTGTVFGDWLEDRHQDRLMEIHHRAASTYSKDGGYVVSDEDRASYSDPNGVLYGMTYHIDSGRVLLDGGSGIESMLRIAKNIGLDIIRTYKPSGKNRGETTGYVASAILQEVTP